jgi:hypothetical protein
MKPYQIEIEKLLIKQWKRSIVHSPEYFDCLFRVIYKDWI